MAESLERLWNAIMDLADHQKVAPIEGKLWVTKVGAWILAVNGCKSAKDHDGFSIKPYNCALWFNGWLAGSFSPFGGAIAAGGLANLDNLIAAIQQEIR